MSTVELQLVDLPGHFVQVQLTGLKDIVDHHHANGHRVQFNAANVDRIDGAAIQFLVAVCALQSDTKEDIPAVINTNEILCNAVEDLGVCAHVNFQVKSIENTPS